MLKRARLPAREFTVHPSFIRGRRIASGICVAMLAGMSAFALYFASDIVTMRREARIWEHGVAVPEASASGTATAKAVFVDYKIRVDYEVDGTAHGGTQEFETVMAGASTVRAPTVKVDLEDPGAFATSWGIESVAGRWRWLLTMVGVALLVDIVMVRQLRATRREVARLRALAARGDEVTAEIISTSVVKLSNGTATPHVRVHWRAGTHGPFVTQVDTRRGPVGRIGLLSEDCSRGMLLTEELYPIEATDAEIAAARASIA